MVKIEQDDPDLEMYVGMGDDGLMQIQKAGHDDSSKYTSSPVGTLGFNFKRISPLYPFSRCRRRLNSIGALDLTVVTV